MEATWQTPPKAAESGVPQEPGRLWNSNFRRLWLGQTISQCGNQAFLIAVTLWVREATGYSTTKMGLFMATIALPGIVLAPLAGAFADSHSRIRIIITCDLMAGMASLGMGLILPSSGASPRLLPLLVAVTVLMGLIHAFFSPALHAAVPTLVPRQRLEAANSYTRLLEKVYDSVGRAAGEVLYHRWGAPLLFIADGLSSLFAASRSMGIKEKPEKPKLPVASSRLLSGTKEGLNYIWAQTGMRDFVFLACLVNFLGSPMYVLLPYHKVGYGFLLAAISAGTVGGRLLAGWVTLNGPARSWPLISGLCFGQLFLSGVGFTSNYFVALAMAFGSGLSLGASNTYLVTLLQKSTPENLLGRVVGLTLTLFAGLMPLGSVLGGWLGDLTNRDFHLLYGGAGALSGLVSLLMAARSDCRRFLAQRV